MKKRIILSVVALILVICFPITAIGADTDFNSAYWWTVVSNMTYYYGSAGYTLSVITNTVSGEHYVYYDYSGLSDEELETYLYYGSNNFTPQTIDTGAGTYELDIVYKWWVPLGSVDVTTEDATFVFTIAIQNYPYVYNASGTRLIVSPGSYMLNVTNMGTNVFNVIGYRDGGTAGLGTTELDSSSFYLSVPYTETITGIPIAGSSSFECVDIYFTTDVLTTYDALGIEFYTFSNYTGANAKMINPGTLFIVDVAANDGLIEFPGTVEEETTDDGSGSGSGSGSTATTEEEILQSVEKIGSQLSTLESLIQTTPEADAIESSNVIIKQEQESLNSSLNDALNHQDELVGELDFNDLSGIEENYLEDYNFWYISSYLSPFIDTKTITFLLVITLMFAMLSFVIFGKKVG